MKRVGTHHSDYYCFCQVMEDVAKDGSIEGIVSCLASRSGIKKEAYAIDYQATLNCLDAGREVGAKHFVLLSAICVRKPLLAFQHAKLKFEAALQSQNDMTYSIVRPTAYFKSVSNQLEGLQKGSSHVLFGDGHVPKCNPIAETDLGTYMIDCIHDQTRHQRVLDLGGPDDPISMKRRGEVRRSIVTTPFVRKPDCGS